MRVFAVSRLISMHDWSNRVGPLHTDVFHGESYFTNKRRGWKPPAASNDNREPLHIRRSGRFVPHVFSGYSFDLVISPKVRQALSSVPHIEFNEVVFEHLVDVAMPELGDFSWFDRDDIYDYNALPKEYLNAQPDVPGFHKAIGPYYQLLVPQILDVEEQYDDIETVPVNFGTYTHMMRPKEIKVSVNLLRTCPIILSKGHRGYCLLFRQDAFALIAPFLDLDYFAIAVLTVGDSAVLNDEEPPESRPQIPPLKLPRDE